MLAVSVRTTFLAATLLCAAGSRAEAAGSTLPPAAAPATYEDERLRDVLAEGGYTAIAPAATDRITFIDVVRHDVFTEHDPWPDFLNLAHGLTGEDVVRRELLFVVGDVYDERLDESARDLRRMFVFSLVRIVPVRRADGTAGVLVFTRDLWSLRFEQGFQVTGLSIDRLSLALTERNVFGRAKVASVRFGMDPSTWSLGEAYLDRRVWLSNIAAQESVDVLFSRATLLPEGIVGSAFVGVPLWSFQAPWGGGVQASIDARVVRQLRGGELLDYDAPATPDDVDAHRAWDQRRIEGQVFVRRQFRDGLRRISIVHRWEVGLAASDLHVAANAETELSPAAAAAFARAVLPKARTQVYPYLAWHTFGTSYARYDDLDTFGQTEAVRLGPSLQATVGAGARAALSSTDFVFVTAGAGAVFAPLRGLVDVSVEASARLEDAAVVNRALSMRVRAATPTFLYGRLLARLDLTARAFDTSNTLVTLGGDNGLRGYASQAFVATGASSGQGTLEWRTLPLDWRSVHVGLAAFYDAGALAPSLDDVVVRHSVGVGVRLLFPQFNRTVYRIDFGVPLDDEGFRVQFSLGDAQMVEHGQPSVDRLDPRP